ncbi:hypothetical protein B296_00038495 [Ensete ventricosum]|uniref:Copine C-terminal domain-containing protein n=1 Tax=Ensete ventricosum TaxID=4639 RepID=A0A426ZJ87_ENSVE|nr:hypothetical protein B296_00038495 [Ensete ventricosum]
MGAGSSRDSEERERGSFQDWDQHRYSRDVPGYQSYPPPPQTYDPPSEPYPPPGSRPRPRIDRKYSRISDNYHTLEQVTEALAQAGLESSNLIVGIDLTKSNEWTGYKECGYSIWLSKLPRTEDR